MRLKVELSSSNNVVLPVFYNHFIQSIIYDLVDDKLASFLHNQGFSYGKRRFKLFTFSRIIGRSKFLEKERNFLFSPPFQIVISSPVEGFIESLAENLVKSSNLRFSNQIVWVDSIYIYPKPQVNPEKTIIRMLSPVTMYSTLISADDKKKTYFYSPFEKEFSTLIEKNLNKKYKSFRQESKDELRFYIEPAKVSKNDEKIVSFKGTIIKAWLGSYKVWGSKELIEWAYDVGIGSKNSQGFGCFEILNG